MLHTKNKNKTTINYSRVYSRGKFEKSHSLKKEAALESGGTAADTSVLLARWQQGKQAVAGMVVVF